LFAANAVISSGVAVTPKRARELALSLENVTEAPHFDRVAFRTPRRIFATLARGGSDLNFMFDLALQARFCALAPEAISPVAGGWGRMGATRCDLKKVPSATFTAALRAAHARANAPRPKAARGVKR
jgi:hypothetical protein